MFSQPKSCKCLVNISVRQLSGDDDAFAAGSGAAGGAGNGSGGAVGAGDAGDCIGTGASAAGEGTVAGAG